MLVYESRRPRHNDCEPHENLSGEMDQTNDDNASGPITAPTSASADNQTGASTDNPTGGSACDQSGGLEDEQTGSSPDNREDGATGDQIEEPKDSEAGG